jgi:hypothetical protein
MKTRVANGAQQLDIIILIFEYYGVARYLSRLLSDGLSILMV